MLPLGLFVLLLFAAPEVSLEASGPALRIAVAGDTGKGADAVAQAISTVHRQAPLDAIILTGDTFYPCGVESERDPRWRLVSALTEVGPPVFPVLGNHDYCGKSDPGAQVRATAVLANWRFPARQYAVRTAVADFVFLDTTPYAKGRSGEAAAFLGDAFRDEKRRWRVVVGHHPVISSGWHGYFPRDEVARMRQLIPALRDTKTDLYIGGHDHHVELLRGRMRHLVSGAGSSPVPPVRLRMSTVFPREISRERIGFAVVEITPRRIRVRFYDGKGRARSEWLE
jgi:tartrate-resistant acid phosphatase type 5